MSAVTENAEAAVWSAHALVNDAKAMEALLRPLPEVIAKAARDLAQGKGGMRHDSELKRAYYLEHRTDGILSCVTFESVSFEQAAQMWAEIDRNAERLSMELFHMVYAKVTGRSIEPVGRRS